MSKPEVGDYIKFSEHYYINIMNSKDKSEFTVMNSYKIEKISRDDRFMVYSDYGDERWFLFKCIERNYIRLIKNMNFIDKSKSNSPRHIISNNIKKGDFLKFTTNQIRQLNLGGRVTPMKLYEVQISAHDKVYIHDDNKVVVVGDPVSINYYKVEVVKSNPSIVEIVNSIPTKMEVLTEDDLLHMIDEALRTKDKRWFNSLTKKLNKLKEVIV